MSLVALLAMLFFPVELLQERSPKVNMITIINFIVGGVGFKLTANVLRLALSGVEPIPSHYKYNKTFHSAADFP